MAPSWPPPFAKTLTGEEPIRALIIGVHLWFFPYAPSERAAATARTQPR
jgi:hypothetical protein